MSKLIVTNISTTIEEERIEKFVAEPNRIGRISFISIEHKGLARMHYSPELGRNIYCWNGKCCKLYGIFDAINIYPIVKYPTDDSGNIIETSRIKFQYLKVKNTKDTSIQLKQKVLATRGLSLDKVDLYVNGKDEQKFDSGATYVDFDFEVVTESQAWRTNPKWLEEVKTKWKVYEQTIETILGIVIENDDEFEKLIELKKSSSQQTNVKMNNVTTTTISSQKSLPAQTLEENTNINDFFIEPESKTENVIDIKESKTENVDIKESKTEDKSNNFSVFDI